MMNGNVFPKTPMWEGWNTQRYPEPTTKYVVCFMQNIRLLPKREDVVKEILKRSQVVVKECGDKYTIVTYNLAVVKTARHIQIQNSPEFDERFIDLGQIHTILSLFSSKGKILEGSAAAYLLSEAKIIARSSINKFLRENRKVTVAVRIFC